MTAKHDGLPSWIVEGPRSALLLWGGGMLVAGLALVGVGTGDVGAPIALAGLFNTIYGIHVFGRLGPDDAGAPAATGAASSASHVAWTGALTALGGMVVMIDHFNRALAKAAATPGATTSGTLEEGLGPWAVTAGGLAVLGVVRLVQGRRMAQKAQAPEAKAPRAKAKVEKRRRMDKSPAP